MYKNSCYIVWFLNCLSFANNQSHKDNKLITTPQVRSIDYRRIVFLILILILISSRGLSNKITWDFEYTSRQSLTIIWLDLDRNGDFETPRWNHSTFEVNDCCEKCREADPNWSSLGFLLFYDSQGFQKFRHCYATTCYSAS